MKYRIEYFDSYTGKSGVYATDAPDRNGAHVIFRVKFPKGRYDLIHVEEIQSSKPKSPILTAGYDEFSYRIISGDFNEDDLKAIHKAIHPEQEVPE